MRHETQEAQLALQYALFTNTPVFITGKAGVGKTTLMKHIRSLSPKKTVVVAPTGVAAINAGGVTIHSFFRIPPCMFLPRGQASEQDQVRVENAQSLLSKLRIDKRHIRLIKSTEMLIIDEISMVRADLLDAIDHILRKFKRNNQPFGGTQLVMVGDLFQLPPVLRSTEESLFLSHYAGAYFYFSEVLKRSSFITIELQKIYRQSDAQFIRLLNEIRNDQISPATALILEQRHVAWLHAQEQEKIIVLTSHRQVAANINDEKLQELPGKQYEFTAVLKGDFSIDNAPADQTIRLKVGARVMFLKNDREKRFYNGKMGTVEDVDEENYQIMVRCDEDQSLVFLSPETWENIGYKFNETTNELDEYVKGSFTQFPVRLAWAITIHKSQGLTFERVVIDAEQAFATGQVYVALSRCRSLEGLYLKTPVNIHSKLTDSRLQSFFDLMNKDDASRKVLDEKLRYWAQTTQTAFQFQTLQSELQLVLRDIQGQRKLKDDKAHEQVHAIQAAFQELMKIQTEYLPQLNFIINAIYQGQIHEKGIEKCARGAIYFAKELAIKVVHALDEFVHQYRSTLSKDLASKFEELRISLWEKLDELLLCAFLSKALLRNDIDELHQEIESIRQEIRDPFRQLPTDKTKKEKKPKKEKGETRKITLALYHEINNIDKVAAERGLARSTIESHLLQSIKLGELKANDILDIDKLDSIKKAFKKYGADELTMVHEKTNGKYDFFALRVAKLDWESELIR